MINKLIIFISFSFLIASIETSNLNVRGMMCGTSCADKIEKQIIDTVDLCVAVLAASIRNSLNHHS